MFATKRRVLWTLMLALAMSVALSFTMSVAQAYDGEITFAGIPWLSDMETAEKILLEQGIIGEEGKDTIELEISRLSFLIRSVFPAIRTMAYSVCRSL